MSVIDKILITVGILTVVFTFAWFKIIKDEASYEIPKAFKNVMMGGFVTSWASLVTSVIIKVWWI